ncbi:maleylpyruvate isomerase family mycothiol-dependent enzyme [Thermomonospora amylolytica]|uniref:maleylpyruvate isomerase family mycothiol-dependent enzyme n=1 Tax=Thermomonospora amylolytica TaxID=1411117 RepID=UPI000E6CC2D7|nr:maleylpyruvate isomerase family mycothiol-dependent enzyme [Thermomonospora amylolytica]
MIHGETDVFDDLAAEHASLETVLAALSPQMWETGSGAAGWTISDVVLHLAQTNELVVASVAGERSPFSRPEGVPLDELMDRMVAADRGAPPDQVFQRWRESAAAELEALRGCPAGTRLQWAAVPLSPRTLAATRIAEHWAHALDVTEPLGVGYPDTPRLRHIARLAQRTLPYAFAVAGEQGGPVRCELTGPDGERWEFGDADAPSVITGPAGEFCRVGARRLRPEDTSLRAEGPHAATALRVLRNYAA